MGGDPGARSSQFLVGERLSAIQVDVDVDLLGFFEPSVEVNATVAEMYSAMTGDGPPPETFNLTLGGDQLTLGGDNLTLTV